MLEEHALAPQAAEADENTQIAQRRTKLKQLRAHGHAFPNDFRRDSLAADIISAHHNSSSAELEANIHAVKIAGRMMTRRIMGKAGFAHVQDMSGQIQIYVRKDDVGVEAFEMFKHWDLGDIIAIEGIIFRTKTNELSVKATQLRLLTKALRPLPEKFHGLHDAEKRARQRYLDLIVNQEVRHTFRLRSQIIAYIRRFLEQRGFLEVETPMMQIIPGGATARPFVTHHNALDMPLYLRVAPELYLKRLVVGGFEKVYELNRNFRNEGVSTRHNPEFTMLEFYQSYADYHDLMDLTEAMFRGLAVDLLGSERIPHQDTQLDFGKAFARLPLLDAVLHYNRDIQRADLLELDSARRVAAAKGIKVKPHYGVGAVQLEIFEHTVEGQLHDPTFIIEYPTEVSPLARRNDVNPDICDRFELFIGTREIANGFSELNDAEDQAERFRRQVEEKEAGDEEAMFYDEDYIRALEHGLPPTAGEGIGIDRLVMLLTDKPSIREVLLFPHMRVKHD
jgi:lysyl-tRNA synthetase, class II